MFRLILSIALISTASASLGQDRIVINFSDDPGNFQGTVFTRGQNDPNAAGSVEGICYGGGCSQDGSLDLPAQRTPDATPPPAGTGGTLQKEDYSFIRSLLFENGENGSAGDPRLSGALGMGRWNMGSGSNNPNDVDMRMHVALSSKVMLPQAVTQSALDNLTQLSTMIASGDYVATKPSVPFPNLPTDDELYDVVINRTFELIFTAPGLRDRDQHHQWWMDRATDYIITSYRAAFDPYEAKTLDLQRTIFTRVNADGDRVTADADQVVSTTEAGVTRLNERYAALGIQDQRATVFDVEGAIRTGLPRSLQSSPFELPTDSPSYKALIDPQHGRSLAEVRPRTRLIARAFMTIEAVRPTSYQGVVAKSIARFLARAGNRLAASHSEITRRQSQEAIEQAIAVLDIATGLMPVTGLPRDLYEAYSGEDLMTGRALSPTERALRIALVATAGFAKYVPQGAIPRVLGSIKEFGKTALGESEPEARALASSLGSFGDRWAEAVANLRRAADGVWDYRKEMGTANDFGWLSGSRAEANAYGSAWVGEDATKVVERGKTIYISKDGLTQYRPPEYKPKLDKFQANFQKRLVPKGSWISNAHFDVTDP